MTSDRVERTRSVFSRVVTAVAVIAGAVAAGTFAARLVGPSVHGRYFPWVIGRALGISAYLSLTALVMLGTWMRHPWRLRFDFGHAEARLRAHATLAVATIVLTIGHLISLASDRYAGVGWLGAIVPGMSHYRSAAVAVGVVGFYTLLLLTFTAGLAGSRGTRHWQGLHRIAALTFAEVWVHGLFAGTDTFRLRVLYIATGVFWILLVTSRLVASPGRAVHVGHVVTEDADESSSGPLAHRGLVAESRSRTGAR